MGSNLNIVSTCKEIQDRLPSIDHVMGKGWMQPFNNTNSGSRKIMQGVQLEQRMQLSRSETPIISTGAENQFAELSSTFVRTDRDLIVIDKIPRYDMSMGVKNSNYWLIGLDAEHGVIDAIERKDYRHISESYGFRMDTKYMDQLEVQDVIPKGTPIIKANSFDESNNSSDGVNLTTVYMALAETTEDPIVVSKSAAKKFEAPLFDTTPLQINDNDILLNLYGEGDDYKTFPDIGEEVEHGLLCAIRRERKDDEALHSQSWNMLKEVLISDDRRTVKGKIIDIRIFCNNPEKLESSIYNKQILKYYNMHMDFCRKIVKAIEPLVSRGLTLTYDAEKLYVNCKDTINGKPYLRDKFFNNIYMEIVTMEVKPLARGDKLTDRYGGKGVVSEIWEDWKMPKYKVFDGHGGYNWEPADVIYDSGTIVNRENPGQSFETEITFVGEKIIERVATMIGKLDGLYSMSSEFTYMENELYSRPELGTQLERCEAMVLQYIEILNPAQAQEYRDMISVSIPESRFEMLRSMCLDGAIYLVIRPVSGQMCLDKLAELYAAFPWVEQSEIQVPQKCSNGQYRFILANRRLITGKKYIYRLKQFAEEKMSSVSLASTNIKGENTKSKANKLHKSVHATTPVRFGEMELEDLIHMKVELVIQMLMLLSTSPKGRRLHEQLLTGDPFVRDIKLDTDSTSRSVETVNALLKTIGLKLIFEKIPIEQNIVAPKQIVRRVPNQIELTDIADRVPHQFRDNILEVAEERIAKQQEVLGLKPIAGRVPLGLSQEQAEILLKDIELSGAVAEICQLAGEYNELGEFKGHESNSKLYERAVNDKPKEKLKIIAHRHIADRIYNPS